MRNITQFLLMLTLSFYIAFAPAVAYADEVTDKIDKLQIDLQKRVGDQWTLSPRNKSVGAGVEVGVSQSYPVTATTTATTAAGATRTSTATLTAEKIGSKIFTPTNANIAKRFARGVGTGLVAMALYDLLGKAVDFAMDSENNQVKYKQYKNGAFKSSYSNKYYDSPTAACDYSPKDYKFHSFEERDSTTYLCYYTSANYPEPVGRSFVDIVKPDFTEKTVPYETLAERSKQIADNPAHKDNLPVQTGIRAIVNDMITNNEIDNSYFNDADISNDTYNDVTNNYVTNNITNQYSSVSVPSQSEMAQAAANGQSSVTKTTQNSNGSTTTTTTTFNTTNNTTNNNTSTNNTYNITNITVNNPAAAKDDSPASTPASTTTPTASTPASTPKPTDSKPFELPAFCDWAKPVCDFIDWFKKDDASDTDVSVDTENPPTIDTDINFGGSCPQPYKINIDFFGTPLELQLLDSAMLCDFLATYINPSIKVLSGLLVIYIMARDDKENA